MAPHKVDVNPKILVWARESIGLSRKKAANDLGMSELTLQYLEEGVGDVSMPRLKAMANIYDRPLISFFAANPGPQTDTLPDFRLTPSNRRRSWSPELHREYRRVAAQREIVLDLIVTADVDPIPAIELRLQLEDDPEDAALRVQHWLLGSTPQLTTHPSLGEWISLIEEKGTLVAQVSGIKVSEMRGFSIGHHPLPVIALNGADSVTARSFTLMHELVHVLLHGSALCDLGGLGRDNGRSDRRNEWFCNTVAASVLMPREDLLRQEVVAKSSRDSRWQFRELRAIAAGKIRNLGRRYIRTVLAAHEQGSITDATLTRYLDIKLKNVPKLIESFGPET